MSYYAAGGLSPAEFGSGWRGGLAYGIYSVAGLIPGLGKAMDTSIALSRALRIARDGDHSAGVQAAMQDPAIRAAVRKAVRRHVRRALHRRR